MARTLKLRAAGLLLVLLVGLIGGTTGPVPGPDVLAPVAGPPAVPLTPQAVYDTIAAAEANGEGTVELDLMTGSSADTARLEGEVVKAGGEVVKTEGLFVRARVPADAAAAVSQAVPAAVGINDPVALPQVTVASANSALDAAQAARQIAMSLDAMGVGQFRSRYGANGRGVTVAVIDTGVDPSHPDLRTTPDGRPKLVDWKDFSGEGMVVTSTQVSWSGATFTAANGRTYTLPARPAASASARFGIWDEYRVYGIINQDLNQNGTNTDKFGVLLVDSTVTGRYDTVYVDTNNNGSFADETPLRTFTESRAVQRMGQSQTGTQANRLLPFVLADLNPDGRWVSFGFDGNGHGTQVAGVLGAYRSGGMQGAAPGVQVMALKAVKSNGVADWFRVKDAIAYAASHGAQVVNVSLGGLNVAAKSDPTASEWLNQIARTYNVLVILAADNTGPGLSSGTTLGSPSEVMAVGSYYSPDMWKRDFDKVVPHESIWSLSGMGPRSDGSFLPTVVAPGGSPTTSPLWLHSTGYTTAVGTSIATPYASAAAALLMDAGRSAGTPSDRISVKRSLELGARRIQGFDVYEQGYGLISLLPAFGHLQQMNSVLGVSARSPEGGNGLLARSYHPASSAFWLTNLDSELARINILSLSSWVQPAYTSMTLPPNVSRELPIRLTPSDQYGVHSAFVVVTHRDRYGPAITIPVTHVRPVELSRSNGYAYAATDQLEVARYRRYFFEVKPGTDSFQVSSRVLGGGSQAIQGTVTLNVFRPDGQGVFTADIGRDGAGLTAQFRTEQPAEGVWEVVVTAQPDSRGDLLTASYSLDVAARPGAIVDQTLKWSVPAGGQITVPVNIINTYGAFTGNVRATGLTRMEPAQAVNLGVPWRVERRTSTIVEDFTTREPIGTMRVEVANPVPANVDLNLYVWYIDPVLGPVQRAASLKPGVGRKSVELSNLPPGRYQTQVVAAGDNVPDMLHYQYRRLMGMSGLVPTVADTVRQHVPNESWSVPVTIQAPEQPGRYAGQLIIWDDVRQESIAWVPFEVSVGQPALSVLPMVSSLVQGQPGTAVLELREAQSGTLVDGTVQVNGQRYLSHRGQVVVPVVPTASVHRLDVTVDLPAYQLVQTQIVLPVRENWSSYPLGVDPDEGNVNWRRKVMEQLQ